MKHAPAAIGITHDLLVIICQTGDFGLYYCPVSKFKRLFKGRGKAVFLTAACIFAAALAGGCQAVRYYSQAIHGQLQIFSNQRPIEQLLASTNTPPRLKKKFEEVLALRRFAAEQLKLPADGNYLKYADLHREFVVWNVTAAPKLSLQPKMWWFQIGRAHV